MDNASDSDISTATLVNNRTENAATFVDLDTETSTLIAELLSSDLEELNLHSKGKSRHGAPPNDAEYAIQLQSEQVESVLTRIRDAQIANRMQEAMRMDQELIQQMVLNEQVARQDHEAALALSRGERLPVSTREQRAVRQGVRTGHDEP